VLDTASAAVSRTISLGPYPGAPAGSSPSVVAESGDGRQLFVANAGNNDVAVVDLATSRITGLIPSGWYPTSLAATASHLFVTSAKGYGAGPNTGPGRPDPYQPGHPAPAQYSGAMMVGTLSVIDLPVNDAQLAGWTEQVHRNDGIPPPAEPSRSASSSIVPRHPGEHSPIQHVIYIVKENRTYDQVLGSLGKGAGDPTLNLFGEESAPNARALARDYVTFDNFYADAEVSAQGWSWTVAANSNPYTEQLWPSYYSKRGAPYTSESSDPAIAPNRDPAHAYIWDRLADAHVSFRNYGFFMDLDTEGPDVKAQDPVLDAATDHNFRKFDLACPDAPNTFLRTAATADQPEFRSGGPSSSVSYATTTCPPPSCCDCPAITTLVPARAHPRPASTSRTTTGPWARSWTPSRTRRTGPPPPSSSPRTTLRTGPTTWTLTAPWPG
jgi:YVTN family beta-propeller protein